MKPFWIAVPFLALLFEACTGVGPDYRERPDVAHSDRFADAPGQPAGQLDRWWRKLSRPELNRFVDEALKANLDLSIATQRLREARALRNQTAGAILPQAEAHASYARLNPGSITGGGDLGDFADEFSFGDPIKYWSSGIDLSWEIDIFGGRRRETRAALAREQVAWEAMNGTRQALVAEVADAYFAMTGLREQLRTLQAQIETQAKQADDMRARVEAGASSQLELSRSLARLETTRAQRPTLEAGITAQRKRLALLLGRPPDALDDEAVAGNALPDKLPMTRAGLPAELILRRPDLRETERELAAATEDIGVAVANFYPRFLIGGSGPTSIGAEPGDLFHASNYIWQFGPRVEWALFKGGATLAALERADARQKAILLGYEKAVLEAIGEVETELANLRSETRRLAIIQRALAASTDAVRRVRENREAGAVSQIDVLVEEEALRDIEIIEIRVKAQMLQVWIRLHKALGGGWQ